MNIFYIILKFVKKIIQTIIKFFKMQFEFLKKTWKTQGLKGILILLLNLFIAFFGGLAYEKTHSKKSRSGRTNNTTERGRIRQSGDTGRRRNINDNPDECRLRGAEEGWEDRNTERNIPGEMRKSQETRQSFKNHSKRVWYTTDDTTEYQAQREENSRRNTGT